MEIRAVEEQTRSICQELPFIVLQAYLAPLHVTLLELSRRICPVEIRIHRAPVFPPISQETLTDSSCRTRSFCSLQFECPPPLRARFRQPQVLENARLPLDRRRRTDAARHQESYIGRMVKSLVLTMSARLNGSDSSLSEYASTRRRKPLASR